MVKNHSVVTKRLFVVVALGAVVMFYFALSHVLQRNSNATLSANVESGLAENTHNIHEKDSDGDGLPDWEELLWGTDPYNPDTAGDGVGDWETVYGLKKQNGGIAMIEGLGSVRSEKFGAENATELLSRRFISEHMLSIQNNTLNITPEKQKRIIADSIAHAQQFLEKDVYKLSEVQTVPSTQQSRTAYVHAVESILFDMTTGVVSEHQAVYAIASKKYDFARETFLKTADHYRRHTEKLKVLSVPEDAVSLHTAMMNNLISYVDTLEGLAVFETDPFRSTESLKKFLSHNNAMKYVFSVFSYYAKSHGVEHNPETVRKIQQHYGR